MPSTNPETPDAGQFGAVAGWCEHYLQFQHNAETARTFAELLRTFSEIAELTSDFRQDQFERRKELEVRIDDLLRSLALAHADSLESRRCRVPGPACDAGSRDGGTKLFVYGTLKRGFSRAAAMAGQRLLGEARTEPLYRIYDCGSYPGLVESRADGVAIEGEVWAVDAERLAKLDDVEGVASNLYRRGQVRLQAPFADSAVQTYFYQRSVSGLRDCGTRWP